MMRFEALLSRRMAREPMAYIIGYREFWSLPFAVGPGVLVPRPESETLIEEALKSFPERNAPLDVLDLGVGSGCLLLSFLHERPQANGIGVDASREALSFAGENTYELGFSMAAGPTRSAMCSMSSSPIRLISRSERSRGWNPKSVTSRLPPFRAARTGSMPTGNWPPFWARV
jgi:HemK-like putative methylase